LHDDVSCFLGLSHHMEDHILFLQIEVEVDLHSSFMGMGWHGVPYASLFEVRHTHDQLTAFAYIRMDILVDGSLVEILGIAKVHFLRLFQSNNPCLISLMGWAAVEVELGWIFLVFASKLHILCAHTDVQAIILTHLELFSVKLYLT